MSIRIAKILFPTDFSELSLHALTYARQLAATFDPEAECPEVERLMREIQPDP
ncbi:MAG: universal stress protein, partial [Planctomycetes bacterium]|nr:universal stress protein [Planctomycetota bacterium]